MFPCVPNTTAVTQETGQSYTLFKPMVRQNLEQLIEDRPNTKKDAKKDITLDFLPSLVGLLVFGGVDEVTDLSGYEDAFVASFTQGKNLNAWAKVGAAPVTQACLKPTNVGQEEIQENNKLACLLLDD